MKRTKKLWLTFFLALLVAALVAVGLTAAAEETPAIIDSGYCGAEGDGTNLTWTLDSEGVFTISGEGEMVDYYPSYPPWNGYRYMIESVVIEEGVTNLSGNMFYLCTNMSLTSVTIPDGVTRIGAYAFSHCYNLKNVKIPNSVTSLGEYAFSYINSMNDIRIPDGVTSIPDGLFYNCRVLTNVTIPDHVTSIGSFAFTYIYNLTSIRIPDGVTSIGSSVFSGCINLTDVTVPDSVTSIGRGAFSQTPWYTALCAAQPDGVVYIGKVAYAYLGDKSTLTEIVLSEDCRGIGFEAFFNCTSLKRVTIPDSVTSIGINAFLGCEALTELTIPNGVTSISDGTFSSCTALTEITIPDSVTSIGNHAFNRCISLTELTIPDGVTSIGDSAFDNCISLTELTIPDSVTSIGEYAFWCCTSLKDLKIFSGLTELSHNEVGGCYALESITLPATLTRIYIGEFRDCTALKDVYFCGCQGQWMDVRIDESGNEPILNATVHFTELDETDWSTNGTWGDNIAWTLYGNGKFVLSGEGRSLISLNRGYPWYKYNAFITSVVIEDGITTIPQECFMNCPALVSVFIPDSVVEIYSNAFRNCPNLTAIDLPDGLTKLWGGVFSGCSSLTSIVIPPQVDRLEGSLFSGCTQLSDITIPEGVSYIGARVFENTAWTAAAPQGLVYINNIALYKGSMPENTTIRLRDGTVGIAGSAFENCSGLIRLEAPESVKWVGARAFMNCTNLKEIVLPDQMERIGDNLINGCENLRTLVLPDGITSIPSYAFKNAPNLEAVTWPASINSVYPFSFENCSNLKNIFYQGTSEEWSHISFWESKDPEIYNATIHFYGEDWGYCGGEGDGTNLVWWFDGSTLTVSGTGAMTDYSESAPAPWAEYFAAPGAEITVLLEEGVTYIGANAFPASDGLKELIVLNRDCDLSALVIREPAFLRGYRPSTAETYGNAHEDESLFMPLCNVDYHHAVVWKVERNDAEDPDGHIQGVFCTVCDDYIYARRYAHEWSEWETVKEPTTEEEGEQTRTCSVCGKTETRSVEKLQPAENNDNNDNNDNHDDNLSFISKASNSVVNWVRKASASIIKWFQALLRFFSKR